MKPGRPLRVAQSKVPMVIQEETNHMVPTISIETHNMDTTIEDKTFPWYLVNTVIDPYTGEILQYKDLMKEKNTPGKRTIKRIWTTSRRIARKSKKGTNTISFVPSNNITVGCTVKY